MWDPEDGKRKVKFGYGTETLKFISGTGGVFGSEEWRAPQRWGPIGHRRILSVTRRLEGKLPPPPRPSGRWSPTLDLCTLLERDGTVDRTAANLLRTSTDMAG